MSLSKNDCTAGPHFLKLHDDCAPMDWSGFDWGECDFDADSDSGAEQEKIKTRPFYSVVPATMLNAVDINARLSQASLMIKEVYYEYG